MPVVKYAATLLFFASGTVYGQMSKSIGWASDYWYRGVSLSQGTPVVQGIVNYDFRDGLFVGLFTSGARGLGGTAEARQWMAFSGYSFRLDSRNSLDVGTHVNWLSGASYSRFNEIYAGLTTETYTLRFYYSPRYLAADSRSLYTDFNTGYPLNSSWNIIFHAGLLESFAVPDNRNSSRYDLRLGLGTHVGFWNFQLLLNTAKSSVPLPVPIANRLALNIVYSF
jgi:uncharacterized protein (TIGR02001 family)